MPPRSGDDVEEQFAVAASLFCRFVEGRPDPKDLQVCRLLASMLCELTALGFALPDVEPANERPLGDGITVDVPALPCGHLYWEIFDPYEGVAKAQPGEPVLGDLADDVLDVYRDLKVGLAVWKSDAPDGRDEAVWYWKFQFKVHWGEHVTGALRALYWSVRQE